MSAHAIVASDKPDRYAKQLVSHLGRKLAFTSEGGVSSATIGTGTGTVAVRDGRLTLTAAGPDHAALLAVQLVLGGHLERFGARDRLRVVWVRD